MSLIKAWAPYFRSSVRMHGRAYQAQGKVRQVPPEDGEWVSALVTGTNQEHHVIIKGEGPTASAACTCAFFASGQYCKHIWATLLDVHYNGVAGQTRVPEQDEDGNETGMTGGMGGVPAEIPALAMPKARRREGGPSKPVAQEAEWVGRLTLLRQGGLEQAPPPAGLHTLRQICYVIHGEVSARNGELVVELKQRQPMRSGWGPMKPLKVTEATLGEMPDAADRELVSLLMGGRRWGGPDWDGSAGPGRGQDTFLVASGAWRMMMQRLAGTGRCFLVKEQEDGYGRPVRLQWAGDSPWVLWLVGMDTGDGLSMHLEFRRGDVSLHAHDPELVLTGPDGLLFVEGQVGPLDDRDASRWIRHFRNDMEREEEKQGLRVPARDMDHFVERLYTLASLPEIDLPEGMGPVEKKMEPVPHLELFSPTAGMLPPFMPGGGGGGAARNMLTARVWFAYAQQKVKPGQAGRFLNGGEEFEEETPTGEGPQEAEVSAETPEVEAAEEREAEAGAPEPVTGEEGANAGPEDEAGKTQEREEQPRGRKVILRRDLRAEEQAVALVVGLGFRPDLGNGNSQDLLGLVPSKLMPVMVVDLLRRGWVVTADRRLVARPGTASLSIASGVDWFELRGGMKFTRGDGTEEVVPLPAVLEAARQGRTMITLTDGTQGLLPEQWLREHGLLAGIGKVEGDVVRFKRSQAALLDTLLSKQELVEVDAAFAEARRKIRTFEGVKAIEAPAGFAGALRPYQKDGLGWLAFLRDFGMGGILADDMGLGKTVQVLAMLQDRRRPAGGGEGKNGRRPVLVIAPRSVVFNWIDEAMKFTPGLKVQAYTGAEREALREDFAGQDLIVTTYGLVRRDVEELAKHPFDYVILDEAQAIKNPGSQVAKAVRLLQAEHKLALTGTPVENHLGDLWSIFEFLNPGMLGAAGGFARMLKAAATEARSVKAGEASGDEAAGEGEEAPAAPAAPAAETGNDNGNGTEKEEGAEEAPVQLLERKNLQSTDVARQLGMALRPFVLRRTKKQVLRDLPPKTEQTILCQMEGEQKEMYDRLLKHYRGSLLSQVDTVGMGRSTVMVLEALLRLRQAACHPGLIDPALASQPFAKLEALCERLEDIVEEGHKALVFSQFTSFLELVRKQLDQRGIVYEYLDGQTRQRKAHVERFQTDAQCPVFLISLKAGGLGLNLTAAEYVFILDPWWNPAVENQAIDRAHRIGQARHVFAYRLICQNTVEERIAQLQAKKRHLAEAIIDQQEGALKGLTREDLEILLG